MPETGQAEGAGSPGAPARGTVADPEDLLGLVERSYGGDPIPGGERDYLDRHGARQARTLAWLPERPGRLLDVGCFPGHTSLLAASRGWSVTGVSRIDGRFVSEAFVARMRRCGIEVVHADIERDVLPMEAATFDAVFFNEIVEHLPFNPFHALDQVWRVLKPGGRLVFSVPNLARFDHIWALLRGRSFYPETGRPLEEAYHADIAQRHVREYTRAECRDLLESQDKYLYRFRVERILMDRGGDGLFASARGWRRRLKAIRPGRLARALATRLAPRYRAGIFIVASKPADLVAVPAASLVVEGGYAEERSGSAPSFVRRPLRARWLTASASVRIRVPPGCRTVRGLDVLLWMPAPPAAGSLRVQPSINGIPCAALSVPPSTEPRRYRMRPATPVALDGAGSEVVLALESTTWNPGALGVEASDRALGPMLGVEEIGVWMDSAPTPPPR